MMQFSLSNVGYAAVVSSVVINEIAWAGSADGSGDEWIELYNASNTTVDLSGFYIEDDGSTKYFIENGVIAPKSYFLIEDSEAVTTVAANSLNNLSLANAGDILVLKNVDGEIVDSVNSTGGAWFAGDPDTKATMERIDPLISGDNADNWATAINGNGAKGRIGSEIIGTPGTVNSNYGGSGAEVGLNFEGIAKSGDTITVAANVDSATDLYAYGFEITYNPDVLKFNNATEGNFLKADGASTAFNAGLVNDIDGTLLVGGARLKNPAEGIDGSGKLFDLSFSVIGTNGDFSDIVFAGENFVSDSISDTPVKLSPLKIEVGDVAVEQIAGLKIKESTKRYALELDWTAMEGASHYLVKRINPVGTFDLLGQTTEIKFIDEESVLPGVNYKYQVVAVKDGIESSPVEITGSETRGLSGDIDKNDRVDGRDIEKLARSFGSEYVDEEYSIFADVNFDGFIDGKDLITLGSKFGLKY